ncbi:hypothetical protein ACFL9U_04855, partial [Thermodesulfobacteriota bacterium]
LFFTCRSVKNSPIYGRTLANSTNGIYFMEGENFYANNRATGHTNSFVNTANNTDGGGNVEY